MAILQGKRVEWRGHKKSPAGSIQTTIMPTPSIKMSQFFVHIKLSFFNLHRIDLFHVAANQLSWRANKHLIALMLPPDCHELSRSQVRTPREEDFSGEEEPHVANPELTEADKQKDEL